MLNADQPAVANERPVQGSVSHIAFPWAFPDYSDHLILSPPSF